MPLTTGGLYIHPLANQKNRKIKYRCCPNLEISRIIMSWEMPLQALSAEKQILPTALRLRSQADLPGSSVRGRFSEGLHTPPPWAGQPVSSQHLCFSEAMSSPFKGVGKRLLLCVPHVQSFLQPCDHFCHVISCSEKVKVDWNRNLMTGSQIFHGP